MNEPEPEQWHRKTKIRVLALLLLPLLIGGLYFISTSIILNRPTPEPTTPDNSTLNGSIGS